MSAQKPKGWQLYALCPLLVVLFVGEHQLPLATGEHQVVQVVIIVVIYGLIHWWMRVNTLALIGLDQDQRGRSYTVTEYLPSSACDIERGNDHRFIVLRSVSESGLRNTLDDTFELETLQRRPKDASLN